MILGVNLAMVLRDPRPSIRFTYKNWRGETATRHVEPRFVWFGETEYYPERQWLMRAYDLDKDRAERDFAMRDMVQVEFVI
jgi:hypothetical protein